MKEKIKAVAFDIGQTLIYYPAPLNWSQLYRPAFEHVSKKLGFELSEEEFVHIGKTLTKYNTRIYPREKEVSSDTIFSEILDGINIDKGLLADIRQEFYQFFRTDTAAYPEAEKALARLKERSIPTATLSDVAYGMDNIYALEDLGPLMKYIDKPYTSNDIGLRKPCRDGLIRIAAEFHLDPSELAFIGDEPKDMECAHNAGATAILINRTDEKKDYGQDVGIKDLTELLPLIR